ncbi:MAG: short-chain dehydrogenase/reductase [Thermoleophilia bacterium]|nr:short-chain dehydrogenase/reductase [Thermoleophilia bacterium]
MTSDHDATTRQLDLHGRTIVVTGASSGIGAVTAGDLHGRGARVIAVGRNPERTTAIAAQLGTEPVIADFGVLADVHRAAAEILGRCDRIDALVNNAGALVPQRTVTVDGHELTFQANHLAAFLLTHLLRPRLAQTAALGEGPVRVVTTASLANRFGHVRRDDLDWKQRRWSPFRCYAQSKLLNILFARELAVRALADGIESYSFHPGNVATGFANTSKTVGLIYRVPLLKRVMLIDAEAGAAPMTRLVVDAELPTETGGYYDRFDPEQGLNRQADDAELAAWLWEESVRLTHLPSKLTTA